MKRILIFGLIIGALLVIFGHKLPFLLPEPLRTWNRRFNPEALPLVGNNLGTINLGEMPQNFQTLLGRSQTVQETVSKITSEAIKSDDQGKPLTEKALEYGRYIYCQQVVEEWQKTNPATKTKP